MKNLSDCRALLVDDARVSLEIELEALKSDHKLDNLICQQKSKSQKV